MKYFKVLLLPLNLFYAFLIHFRNMFFDIGMLKVDRVNAGVISVGNLTVGGSGKTPLVIYLLDLLKSQGMKPAVLSRGYGRETSGYILVSRSGELERQVNECGDEIYQTVMECKVPAAVSERRVTGAKRLITDSDAKTIVLDDAFQHRWLYRDLDLLICEQRFLVNNGIPDIWLLPSGLLREPLSAIKRADAIIINRKFSPAKEIPSDFLKYAEGKRIFTACYNSISFVDLHTKAEHSLDDFRGQNSLVVSGIANPLSFFNVLKQANINAENRMSFRDHKHYSLKEIQEIRKKFYSTNSHSVVTTEKDAVKLLRYSTEIDDVDIFFLKIKLEPDNPEEFNNYIISELQKKMQIRNVLLN